MLWIHRPQFDHTGNANWRIIFVPADDGLSYLAVNAIGQLFDGVELTVFHGGMNESASNSTERELVFPRRC